MDLFRGTVILRDLDPRNGWRQQEPTGEQLWTVTSPESGQSWTYRIPEEASQFYDALEQNAWGLNAADWQLMTTQFQRPPGQEKG